MALLMVVLFWHKTTAHCKRYTGKKRIRYRKGFIPHPSMRNSLNEVDVVSLVIRGTDISLVLQPSLDEDSRRSGDVPAEDPLVLDADGLWSLAFELRAVLQGHDLHAL